MIVWSGWGLLTPVTVLVVPAIFKEVLDGLFGRSFYLSHLWAVGLMLLASAGICAAFWSYFRKTPPITLIDDDGFEKVVIPSHDFFFVPMRVWAVILGVFGLVVLFRGLFG